MTELGAHGVKYRTDPDVYDPSDDTFLLMDAVRREPPGLLLEVGTGTGLVAIAAAHAGHRVTATDRSKRALRLAHANARLNGVDVRMVRADLTRGLRAERFDLIAFNPPYLPTQPEERVPGPLNLAFDGGLTGLDTVRRFLAEVPRSVPVLIATSSLQAFQEDEGLLSSFGEIEVVAQKSLPHERLRILRLNSTRKG